MGKDLLLRQVAVVDIGVEGRDQIPGLMAVAHRQTADRTRPFELVHTVHRDCLDCSRLADLSHSSSLHKG